MCMWRLVGIGVNTLLTNVPILSRFMMTSSNGNIFRVIYHLCGEVPGPGEFPAQRPVTRSFDVFFDMRLNKRLSKQSWGWWFEKLSRPLWRHCNVLNNPGVHSWFFGVRMAIKLFSFDFNNICCIYVFYQHIGWGQYQYHTSLYMCKMANHVTCAYRP